MGTAQQIYVDFDSFYGILCNKDIPATIYWYNETASTKNKLDFFKTKLVIQQQVILIYSIKIFIFKMGN